MKTIVVPTDFSASAEHAALYAAQLAKTIEAAVLLLHVYQLPVTMNDFPVLLVSPDEMKRNTDEALRRAGEAAQKAAPDVTFETESRMGDVVDEINDVCANRELVALVTGTKDLSGFEKFLMGSTTLSIIKNCSFPVIAVPEKAALQPPSKVALAVDLLHSGDIPVQKIKDLARLFNAELQIVHVEEDGKQFTASDLPSALQGTAFHSLNEDDVAKGIQHFASQNGIDLVVVMPHKHNLYERPFFKGHTKGIINSASVPVMCIHP